MKWIKTLNEDQYYEQQQNDSHLWLEYKENKIHHYFSQISIEIKKDRPVVTLKMKKKTFYVKLTEGNAFFGYHHNSIKTSSRYGLWAKIKKTQGKKLM